jgi:hypothetical protein
MALAGAVLATALAAPMAANASLAQCTGSKMCVWGNNDFQWLLAAQDHGQGVIDVFNDAAGENNAADSWQNRSNSYAGCLYNNSNGTGALLTMGKADKKANVSFTDSDKTSSMRTNGAC